MAVVRLLTGIYQITVDRLEKFNALSPEIIAGLEDNFKTVCDVRAARVIIFRGAPVEGKFLAPLAGADLDDLVDLENQKPIGTLSATQHMKEGIEAILNIRTICKRHGVQLDNGGEAGRVVVIGWVDGPCLAGGIEFMYGLADLVYATPRSTFGMREILFGGMGGWMGPQLLRERLGSPLWVKEMLLAVGRKNKDGDIDAITAQFRGLLNGIYEMGEIEETVLEIADQIVKRDPLAVSYNLEMAEFPAGQDCTPTATNRMVALMQRPAWVKSVCSFLTKGKK